MAFTITWTVTKEEAGLLLREYLRIHKHISRSALTDIKFKGGYISCNEQEVNVRHVLREHDQVTIVFPKEEVSESLIPFHLPLDIVYEDDAVLVVNKPPHLPTIPSREHPSISLANAVLFYYNEQNIKATIHMVNRLDKDTSGLVLIAKHRYVHSLLSTQQQNGTLKRKYQAFAHGAIDEEEGTIDLPIARKEASIIERTVNADGQRAITHFKVLDRYEGYTHVALSLETGRTHQIRVHLSAIGHPLLGDTLYGGTCRQIERQALHSGQLAFFHPFKQKMMTFSVDLPYDMKKLKTPH